MILFDYHNFMSPDLMVRVYSWIMRCYSCSGGYINWTDNFSIQRRKLSCLRGIHTFWIRRDAIKRGKCAGYFWKHASRSSKLSCPISKLAFLRCSNAYLVWMSPCSSSRLAIKRRNISLSIGNLSCTTSIIAIWYGMFAYFRMMLFVWLWIDP